MLILQVAYAYRVASFGWEIFMWGIMVGIGWVGLTCLLGSVDAFQVRRGNKMAVTLLLVILAYMTLFTTRCSNKSNIFWGTNRQCTAFQLGLSLREAYVSLM